MKTFQMILTMCLFSGMSLSAAEWFVDKQKGNDTFSGKSSEKPFKTIARAIKAGGRSDTINIKAAPTPYFEPIKLVGTKGTATKPFVINGGGAVISGLQVLELSKWVVQGKGYFYKVGKRSSNQHLTILINGKVVKQAASPEKCVPGSFCWTGDGFFYVPEMGKKPADLSIQGTLGDSGVMCVNAKNVIVRDIISERHSNDGFNLHGSCHSLIFQNIVGRNNGDDGFSIHEDGEVVVMGGEFHHNDYGIQDINASRSMYHGVKVYNNRVGINFSGGTRSLIGSLLKDNPVQISLTSGVPSVYLPQNRDSWIYAGNTFIKNTVIRGGDYGIQCLKRTKSQIVNCALKGCKTGIYVGDKAECVLKASLILDSKVALEFFPKSGFTRNCNIYYPAVFMLDKKSVTLKQLQGAGNDARSLAEKPKTWGAERLRSKTQPFTSTRPRVYLGPEL